MLLPTLQNFGILVVLRTVSLLVTTTFKRSQDMLCVQVGPITLLYSTAFGTVVCGVVPCFKQSATGLKFSGGGTIKNGNLQLLYCNAYST